MEALDSIMRGSIYVPDLAQVQEPEASETADASARIAALTPAQMNVLSMIKRGKLNKQIAFELGIGDSMVKAHVSEIMRKLGVRTGPSGALRLGAGLRSRRDVIAVVAVHLVMCECAALGEEHMSRVRRRDAAASLGCTLRMGERTQRRP